MINFRTTPENVIAVMGDVNKIKDPTTTGLLPFIVMANQSTTEFCASAVTDDGRPYGDDRLALIETWLAAHYATLAIQRQALSETAGEVSETFEGALKGDLNAGFLGTRFGAAAISMDTAGGLLRLSYRMSKGILKNKTAIYGGSRNQFPNANTDFNQPGFFPG